ncbi:MAG: transposon-transfer assisting family protein [Oscillospiraceae bacterium]|nr:transposon-transfer assisting family protein [Oscillospiraceae bacterium]
MNELFTVEEANLMCIFNTSGRERLMTELTAAIGGFDESELIEIAKTALAKLSEMSNEDFAALDLYPEYGDGEETEVV